MSDEDQIEYRVLSEHSYRARKRHICDFCRKPIEPGQRYYCVAALCEGDFEYHRSHGPQGWCLEERDGPKGR